MMSLGCYQLENVKIKPDLDIYLKNPGHTV